MQQTWVSRLSKNDKIFLGLGTNLGNKDANLKEAIKQIATIATVEKQSPVYNTEPFGITAQPCFLNQVVQITTGLELRDLLQKLQQVEVSMGRIYTIKNGPRIIDIDLLFFGHQIIKDNNIEIPHPSIVLRESVLQPLCDIAPDFVHPVECKKIEELYIIYVHT
jgi:2-amino-4-hydroxy-6-hydroxymethyldihydropteridine diphosphokinase